MTTVVFSKEVCSTHRDEFTNFMGSPRKAMSLLMTDLPYLEGRNGEPVVRELAAIDSHITGSHHTSLRDRPSWKEVPMFNARMNQAIEHGCNWYDGDIPYSELETATSRGIICCCNLLLRTSENRIY